MKPAFLTLVLLLLPAVLRADETAGGWQKYAANPVLGGKLGTCFDISVLREGEAWRMWFSWRPKQSLALAESRDGFAWGEPRIVLGPNGQTAWEKEINRPCVLKIDETYHLWYTGQADGKSWIGYATSTDGAAWKRMSAKPVLTAERRWEGVAVMCPHVLYDAKEKLFRMWYSAGEQIEPNAIGYVTSKDGLAWARHGDGPVFRPDPQAAWEKDRVTGCQVVPYREGYAMFYIGFRDRDHAAIGAAWSKDGMSAWKRHPANPLISPGEGKWDHDAVYKPYAIFDGKRWILWYNGRRGTVEQIGAAVHEGEDLGLFVE